MKKASRSATPKWTPSTSPAMRSIRNGTTQSNPASSRNRSRYCSGCPKSTADLASGAALTETQVKTPAGAPWEFAYTNVHGKSYQGKSYSSYESFGIDVNGFNLVDADDMNLTSTSDALILDNPGLTVTRGGGAETLQVGTGVADPLTYNPTQTI